MKSDSDSSLQAQAVSFQLLFSKKRINWKWFGGIAFTCVIAAIGMSLAGLPFFDRLGSMVTAILIAVVYRQFFGYPEAIQSGIQFSAKKILRYAIVLFGFKLNIDTILHNGLGLLARDAITIVFAIGFTMLFARLLKADRSMSLLLGIGTGVCGAAAIAAVSPILKAKGEDTAITVGIIALMGTIFTIVYTILFPYLHLKPLQYGIWSGISLHEIAHVAAAAAPVGQQALAIALLAKLGRVLLLVPLSFILTAWMKRKGSGSEQAKVEFPWFLVGFVVTSILGTYLPIPKPVMQHLGDFSSFLLTAAMVGLGLNVSLQVLRTKAFKPLLAMFFASILLSAFTYITILL
ncbi:putative sulfate exporter family transporter [Fodinisporobacter ferrooxydans]|uniref:Sulfate exporter family transporter n=1 Tax=Fodinisporobacter ferrooxydans TaxID=2901836 RepID=A0ABY4CE62_9BACL|nr:putative sulfate exporter family transporter [Alicyclobacillaceae bacterium MYW30-H2]